MPLFEGCANVLSACQPRTSLRNRKASGISLDAQDASSNLRSIRSLFAAAHAAPEQRAHKRRKVDHGNAASVPIVEFEPERSIVLANVSLEFNIPSILSQNATEEPEVPSTLGDYGPPLVVSLESFFSVQPNAFEVVVYNPATATGTTIVATANEAFLESITPHLRTVATLAITHDGKRSRFLARASFAHCLLLPPTSERATYKLEVAIRWTLGISVVEAPSVGSRQMKEDLKLLSRYFPDVTAGETAWTLADFYDAVHVPPKDLQICPRVNQALSETTLYPFQGRAVDWLMRREGVSFSPAGTLEPFVEDVPPASFKPVQDATGRTCHVSRLRGMVVADLQDAGHDTLRSLRGGILAEEMGLGKTVEIMALMTHHKREVPPGKVFDEYTATHVTPSGATLIITPPSILEQWISELNNHAPELKVFHYKGLPAFTAPKKEHASATLENLMRFDVVVTTYNVLSKEIHHAKPPPDRAFRSAKRHEHRISPLVQISWWRVCLDEAQMIENGVSQAATVARIIPRCNAWAVSGTPLRKDVQDLRGLLVFLRCDAFANNNGVWDRLDKASFQIIFNQIALRHTKDKVREELRLPPQKRVVITVPFTTIEEQNYDDLIRQMCDACWLSPDGHPLEDGRDANDPEVIERMRDWLVRLRQTCLHAHVGRKNRRALGAKNGALRTIHEVLEVMIDQNHASWQSGSREMILYQIQLGHIKAYAGDVKDRAQSALPYYEEALKEAQTYVRMCREEIGVEKEKLGGQSTANGIASSAEHPPSEAEDEKDDDNLGRLPSLRKGLRSFLEIEHACNFFIATTYHQIQENAQSMEADSADIQHLEGLETDWYQRAKMIRRELLKEAKSKAQRQMRRVETRKPFHQIVKVNDLLDLGGIESRQILSTMDNISDFLNAQGEQIQVWRNKIVEILLLRLVDDDDDQEITGEEYDESVKSQDELYVYIMALRTLVADRNAATQGLQDALAEHEMRAAENQALSKPTDGGVDNRGHAPELMLEVAATRRKLQGIIEGGSLKGVVSGVRSLVTGLQWRADSGDSRAATELNVLQRYLARVQTIMAQETKAVSELEKEQEVFRASMNQRLEYYRQFQHISDAVAKYKDKLDEKFDEREFVNYTRLRDRKKDIVAKLKTKYTYLTNLRDDNHDDAKPECIICQDEIELGVLTTCGHKYCKVCINTWWHQHRTCPMCKQRLSSSDFKDISFKPVEIKAQEEAPETASPSQPSTPGSSNTSIYTDISDSTMREIKMIDLDGSYGSKIDMIARHLLWIRANDPGAKSLIFSQFGDFLDVLRDALRKWRIGASSITDKDGIARFKSDPAIDCFLLDAKSDSSGLNLVNATYVFLCEPLINPSIELQAIARVHRIGQQRATTVFMYLISDTVEEAIYDISVARRLAHLGKGTGVHEASLEKANSAELQGAPLKALLRGKGNGEEVKEGDLWRCLFGRQRKVVKPVVEREVARHLRAEAGEGRADVDVGGRF